MVVFLFFLYIISRIIHIYNKKACLDGDKFMKNTTYIKCPRCELNYIKSDERYCAVCKAEMKMEGGRLEISEELEDLELCPVCGQNFISSEQSMCEECVKRHSVDDDEDEKTTIWSEDIETKLSSPEDEVELVSLSEIAESEDVEDDSFEEEDEEIEDSDKIIVDDEDDFELEDFDDYDEEEDDEDYDEEDDEEDEKPHSKKKSR